MLFSTEKYRYVKIKQTNKHNTCCMHDESMDIDSGVFTNESSLGIRHF